MQVGNVMARNVEIADRATTLLETACKMRDKQIRRLAVLDQEQRLVGMLSLGDIAMDASKALGGETLQDVSRPSH